MPYPTQKEREEALTKGPQNAGQLCFLIYRLMMQFLKLKGHSFVVYCFLVGAPIFAILELYERHIKHRETKKIQENGDVC